ncbi:MAG: aldehyde dehydrogenase [Microscillaceae bacterium]|nr:aldehyde dehydrogenase [Microscillaceae bacterium]
MQKIQNYIGGQLVPPLSGNYLDNYNPATGEIFAQIPDSDERDVQLAVESAQKAFAEWSLSPVEERSNMLNHLGSLILKKLNELALAECNDNGKSLFFAKQVDIPRAAKNFKFYATAILHFSNQAHIMENNAVNYTRNDPMGIVGCISPWNLPLYLFTWKIAPALAAGNCVIAKPSEITPLTAFLLSEICREAELPPGVLNIVHGLGSKAGAAIVAHPEIKAISFTGGTKTGESIARTAAPMFKKLSLELGGKNPNIIFADSNYEEMLKTTLRSSFDNQGQICLCGSRIFVERPIYEKFKHDFVQRTQALIIGDPLKTDTYLGALVSEAHLQKVLSYVALAKEEGGHILTGGKRIYLEGRCAGGYFMEPTIIENLSYDCRTNQEEIFGPVVTLMPFDTEEEVIKYANSVRYGLAASIWTNDINRSSRVAQQLQSGIVWVNCWMLRDLRTPFGGMKDSGVGREGGFEAIKFFTEAKNVCVKIQSL